jgi:exosortase D (VPLPA-CTERM-specific)
MTLETATGTIKLRRSDWRNWGGLFALLVAVSVVIGVWRSLDPLVVTWGQQEYSHAWFILPLAALIFLQRFRTVQLGGARTPGVLLAILAVSMMLFGWATGSYTVSIDGAILGFIGFVWSSLGSSAIKTVGTPLIYLLFMVPVPVALYIYTSAEMQLLSSKLGITLISLFQVPASLDGNIIVLSSAKLEVAEACSGLRYLFPLISFAFLICMMMKDQLWKKVFLLLSSIPIAIIMNACRIALIAILLERFDIDTSSGSAHDFEGFAVFSLCVGLLFLEVWFLLGLGSPRGRFVAADLVRFDRESFRRLSLWPASPSSLLAGMLLLAGACLVASLPPRLEITPKRQPFALFPLEFKGWHGTPQTLDSQSLDALGLTDYLIADYTNEATGGDPLNFYVAYYASQRAGIRAHSPQLCIPGGGWNILRQSIITLPLAGGTSISANRVVIEKHDVRQLVYYWFDERGRNIANESALKYYALRDALLDRRSDGALVRIVIPIHTGDDEASADALVGTLAAEVTPLLPSYIPGVAPQ